MPKIFEVGGCIRDSFLGLHSKDIDFTFVLDDLNQSVDQGWDSMLNFLKEERFKIFLETPDCFTVRAKFPNDHTFSGLIADFVMARKEIGVIAGTRKPVLELGTLEDDLARRDFTVNAIAKAEDGTIIDIFNGVEHINEKMLITPLDPIVTFMDDPLRTLRALRFSITKGFKIHPDAWDAMFQPGLIDKMEEVVSTERIKDELHKMMSHDALASMRLLQRVDSIEPRFMEIVLGSGIWFEPTMKKVKGK